MSKFAFGAMVAANYAVPLLLNKSVGQVSDASKLQVTPANWTFGIWGIIYVGLAYCLWTDRLGKPGPASTTFNMSCFLNACWILAWLSDAKLISQGLLYALAGSLYLLWKQNQGQDLIAQNVIAIYLAWCLGASILNTAINNPIPSQDMTSDRVLAAICLIQGFWQVVHKDQLRDLRESMTVPLVGIWTALGILTNGNQVVNASKALSFIVACGLYHFWQLSN